MVDGSAYFHLKSVFSKYCLRGVTTWLSVMLSLDQFSILLHVFDHLVKGFDDDKVGEVLNWPRIKVIHSTSVHHAIVLVTVDGPNCERYTRLYKRYLHICVSERHTTKCVVYLFFERYDISFHWNCKFLTIGFSSLFSRSCCCFVVLLILTLGRFVRPFGVACNGTRYFLALFTVIPGNSKSWSFWIVLVDVGIDTL